MAEPYGIAFGIKSQRRDIADAVAGAVHARSSRLGRSAGHGAVFGRTSMPAF